MSNKKKKEAEVIEAEFDILEPDVEVKKPAFEVVEADGVTKVEILDFDDPEIKPSEVGKSVALRKAVVLGNARININELTAYVENKIAEVGAMDIATAEEKDIRAAQADMNRLAKELSDERISLNKEWMSPFDSFIADPIKELVEKIEKGKQPIADKLKELTELWEKSRLKDIKDIKDERLAKESEIIHKYVNKLSWFDNPRWMNKTFTAKKMGEEVDEKVTKIVTDLKALEGAFESQLIELYAEHGDLGKTILERDRLQKAAEEYARVQKERELAKQEQEARELEEQERLRAVRDAAAGKPTIGVPDYELPEAEKPKEAERTVYKFEIKATQEEMKTIAQFINSLGVPANLIKEDTE